MRKIFTVLLIPVLLTAAIAQEEEKENPLQIGVAGIIYTTAYKGVLKDSSEEKDGIYAAARIKPHAVYQEGSFKALFKLKCDATFGTAGESNERSTRNIRSGAEKKNIEVAQAYASTGIYGIPGLSLTGGIAEYDFPLVWWDNAPLANINFSHEMFDFGLYFIKPAKKAIFDFGSFYVRPYDNTNEDHRDKSQLYIADAKIKFGESSIRPAIFAYQWEEKPRTGEFKDTTSFIYALSGNLTSGTAGLDAAAVYIRGKDEGPQNVKYSAFAADFSPYMMIETIKASAFFTIVSGDTGNPGDSEVTSFRASTVSGGGSGINSWRLFLLEDGGSFITNSDFTGAGKYTRDNGYLIYGVSAFGDFGRITAKVQAAYIQAQKPASGQKKSMGYEADLNAGYDLTNTSKLYIEGAYLKTGRFYQFTGEAVQSKIQDAYYLNFGMTYSI